MNSAKKRVVFDTSTLIGVMINPHSVPALALAKAVRECEIFVSAETLEELQTVLSRDKFDRYFKKHGQTREEFFFQYFIHTHIVEIMEISTDCSDPKDNKFLSLALSAKADIIVSSDVAHLIVMHPYKGIDIISPAAFLRKT
ncbi:MAG: putative toxin-antitoxin system toxin component, PIN family [Gammaproteobacteria bacterium]|nr:putative toxin-antitoxin system toxin component, PIN family [Gammaproteobacteria bacterium]MBU1724308.1 putative toxin-antitoxin system toxin component, PIN family [Gammaproteobacteria bacterium]MBU2006264.1 putative toxin-antitoxin system toxin component, PIN family [Gammaproteobacteria bacterium]